MTSSRCARVGWLAALLALVSWWLSMRSAVAASAAEAPVTLILVVGAPGTPDYASRFAQTAARWQKAGARAGATVTTIGLDAPGTPRLVAASDKQRSDRDRLQAALRDAAGNGAAALWLVFIGHGTHDGRATRFNLRGPDVSAAELATWCKPLVRPFVFINGASASGPFLQALAGPQRTIVTATKSGAETNATRFGDLFAEAIAGAHADLDRDGGVSVLEAFLYASKQVEAAFQAEGLLASEHALLEDTGDGLGTPASFFRGLDAAARGGSDSEAERDGARARQITLIPAPAEQALPGAVRARRDQLEAALAQLRQRRDKLGEAAYYQRLERIMLDLARLYRDAGRLP